MDIRQLLGMLQGVSGPNASGEYTARCPAHKDHTASMTVTVKRSGKDGKDRIYLCCHAGCTSTAIMAALGVEARELIVDPDPERRDGNAGRSGNAAKAQRRDGDAGRAGTAAGARRGSTADGDRDGTAERARRGSAPADGGRDGNAAKTQRGPGAPTDADAPAGTDGGKDRPRQIDWDHPDRVYSYTDEDGTEVFQVVRYHYLEGPGKTFRQRMKATAEMRAAGIRIGRDGYVNSVPAELRDRTLYKMPNVRKSIADGKAVYVVEGEKDVETLERLGFAATCNPGGAGKWQDGHSKALAGADVIILPDNDSRGNDYTGQNHAYDVALKLQGIAKRVRLVDLKEACAELPEKGDISDMVAILGDTGAMDALARQVAATPDFDTEAVPFWLSPMEQAERLYGSVSGYGISDGCIAQRNADGYKALSDFVVLPRMEMTRDDGVSESLYFVLDGWNQRGRKLGRVTIRAAELDTMGWVTEKWGFDASLAPGSTTKGKLSWVIKKVGQMTAKRITEYNHSGWRKIDGKYCYLYHGGAIGREGVTVDMGEALKTYRLDGGGAPGFDEIPPIEAALTSWSIQSVMKEEVGIALLGTAYLAPLREFLMQTDVVPAFALFLYGESGTHKTTAAALAMAHYGNFHAKNPPASFSDTGNQIRKKAFLVKDAPILVDDYHPVSSVQEKRQMAATAQTLSRAFGDGVDRGRLNADSTIRATTPPRSVAIITGEDLPAIGASGLARYFILDIDRDDIPVGEGLTAVQEKARSGVLQKAMRGYIEWLLGQTDELPQWLHDTFLRYRDKVRTDAGGQHDRAPEAVACILIGYTMMLRYFQHLGLFDGPTCAGMLEHARGVLEQASRKQARDMESEKPTRIFLDSLSELLSSRQAVLKDLTLAPGEKQNMIATERMIGYVDHEYYYLLPNVAFAQVSGLCRQQGTEFPVSLKALYKHLRTDGILPGLGRDENPTRNKWIDGKAVRLLWIPVEQMRGPQAEIQQQSMTVPDDVLPPEFRGG